MHYKYNSKYNSSLIAIFLVALLIISGGYYYKQSRNMADLPDKTNIVIKNDTADREEDGIPVELSKEVAVTETMKRIVENTETLTGTLDDVTGGKSTGTAYLLRTDDGLIHLVEATLPNPAEGSVYEGWLVNKSEGITFFSTGIMNEIADGVYTLEYTSSKQYEGYNFVVITEETVVDDTPETHIIEGTVQ